ncbi:MAG: hypothetical protein B7Z10_07465 [Rhodobacterales bacterium 32-66-7]|nr:MAG: hypothetical protein B7Z10_07465 [Rhodobacterales bacterium 32-66-7]
MPRIALNGLGRIGKLVLRDLIDTGAGVDLVLLNDPEGDAEQHALLMEFDSVHGRWKTPVRAADGALVLNGTQVRLTHERTLEALPLAELGVDIVIDATGVFKTGAKIEPYFAAGVKKVVVSAPVKDGGALNIVYGVNHDLYDGSQRLLTAASCTTNCLAPVVKVIHEGLGIRHGSITTIHDMTNTQTIVDRPAKDMRRARSALLNLIPTTTGSAPSSADSRLGVLPPITYGRVELEAEVLKNAVPKIEGYGIRLLDVRFKRIDYDPSVSQSIHQRMISEREQIAKLHRAEGEGEAAKINGERERDLATIESEAYRKVQELEGTADAKATEIYAKAYNQTPEAAQLFDFLKTMETYKQLITSDTTMIFTTESELFRYLKSSDPQATKPAVGVATPEFTPLHKLPTLLEVGR